MTTDRGRTWWETYLGEDVAAVVPSYRNELVAYVEQSGEQSPFQPGCVLVAAAGLLGHPKAREVLDLAIRLARRRTALAL